MVVISEAPGPLLALAELAEDAKRFARSAKARATIDAYASDIADFERFCAIHGLSSLPAEPQTVGRYVSALAITGPAIPRLRLRTDGAAAVDLRPAAVSTIRRRLVAVAQQHRLLGHASPTENAIVREIMQGIARELGTARKKKTALTLDLLELVLRYAGTDLMGLRDRALMLVAFSGAFRRSEVAALTVDDVRFEARGAAITLRRSKTDQEGEGRVVALPRLGRSVCCPVAALETWLAQAGITSGPVFRTFSKRGDLTENSIGGRDVARIVQRLTAAARLDGDFAAHSLRAGFVTSAARKKVPEIDIARVTGHRSFEVLRGYVRDATLFVDDSPLATIIAGTH